MGALGGAPAMMVDTGAKNSQAQRFYRERMGYRRDSHQAVVLR